MEEDVNFSEVLGGKYGKPETRKNSKELSIENKSMTVKLVMPGLWSVEWMRLAGCSLYTYTVCA
jgi:hypothetical protein